MRRHLGLSMREARRLPWFEYEALVEGIAEEFSGEDASQGGGEGSLDDLGAAGLTVREVG